MLVNLWATWCVPCRKEMPSLAALQSEMGSKDFEVVAISVDRKGLAASSAFLKEVGATALKLYADPSTDSLDKLQAVGLPASILIDREGREIGRLLGPAEWNSPEAKALIKAALEEPAVAHEGVLAGKATETSASAPASRRDSRRSRDWSCGRASRPRHILPARGRGGISNPPGLHREPA